MDKVTELSRRLEPFTLRLIGDVLGARASTGAGSGAGYTIVHVDISAGKARHYSVDSGGLTSALAAASSGDMIILPASTIAGNHTIPADIEVIGVGYNSVLSGDIINNGVMSNLSLTGTSYDGNGRLIGVMLAINKSIVFVYRFDSSDISKIYNSIIVGDGHDIENLNGCIVAGATNDVADCSNSVCFGIGNDISGGASGILSGQQNELTQAYSAVVSGRWNDLLAANSVILGGWFNAIAIGATNALAWGYRVNILHQGAMLFADYSDFTFPSVATNEFAVRATGGIRFVIAIDGSGSPIASVVIDSAGNVTVPGDLTISGDDIFMATNTANFFLMADDTNYNPTSPADARAGLDVFSKAEIDARGTANMSVMQWMF